MSNTTLPETEDTALDDWCLFVAAPVDGMKSGVRRTLARGGSIEVGRDDGSFAQGVFADGRVSRRHAKLEVDDAGVLRICDLGSSNGTFVNGARIERVSLAVGDVVRIGAALLVVQKTPARFSLPQSVIAGVGPAIARMQFELMRALSAELPIAIIEEPGSGGARLAREIHRIRGAAPWHEWSMQAWTDRLPASLDQALGARERGTIVLTGLPPRRTLARSLVIERLRTTSHPEAPRVVLVLDASQSYEPELSEAVAAVRVPPLRDRPEDIVPSALAWAQASASTLQALSTKAWLTMLRSPWPGNVAQLNSALQIAHDALASSADEDIDKWIRDAATREISAPIAEAPSSSSGAYVFARSGKWFTVASGERVSLHRREVLGRVLSALIRARDEHPGRVISVESLIANAWQGERFIDGSGENRLHVALTNLRQIGLRPIIERIEDGYRLNPAIPTRIVDE